MCNLVYWIGKLLHPDNWKADLDYISGNITQEGERLILDSLEMRFSSYKNDFPSVIESLGIDGLNLSSNDRNLVLTLRRSGLEELNALIELAGQNARYCEAFHLEELKGLTVETLLANVHMPMVISEIDHYWNYFYFSGADSGMPFSDQMNMIANVYGLKEFNESKARLANAKVLFTKMRSSGKKEELHYDSVEVSFNASVNLGPDASLFYHLSHGLPYMALYLNGQKHKQIDITRNLQDLPGIDNAANQYYGELTGRLQDGLRFINYTTSELREYQTTESVSDTESVPMIGLSIFPPGLGIVIGTRTTIQEKNVERRYWMDESHVIAVKVFEANGKLYGIPEGTKTFDSLHYYSDSTYRGMYLEAPLITPEMVCRRMPILTSDLKWSEKSLALPPLDGILLG